MILSYIMRVAKDYEDLKKAVRLRIMSLDLREQTEERNNRER